MHVVGDVGGRIAIMVDDMLGNYYQFFLEIYRKHHTLALSLIIIYWLFVDDVKSFVDASLILKERGAYKIYVLATHGILSADAPRLIEESPIDEVVVTNTVPHDMQKLQCHKNLWGFFTRRN